MRLSRSMAMCDCSMKISLMTLLIFDNVDEIETTMNWQSSKKREDRYM